MVTWAADTFTRGNSSTTLGTADIGGAWTAQTGTWGISSNKGYCATPVDDVLDHATLTVAQADVTISCDITLSATTNRAAVGLTARFADANNWLEIFLTKVVAGTGQPDNIQLRQMVAGGYTLLGEVTAAGLANGATYAVKVVISGTTIAVYVDGARRIPSTSFSTTLTTQKYGLLLYSDVNGAAWDDGNSRFDNFSVTTEDRVPRMGRVLSS